MVDVLCAVAASASVNGPLSVNITDALLGWGASSALSFRYRDSLTHELSNLLVLAEENFCETPFSVDFGSCDCESARESVIHLGKPISPTSLLVLVAGSNNCKSVALIRRAPGIEITGAPERGRARYQDRAG